MIKQPKGKIILVCPCATPVWPILVGQTDNHSIMAFDGTLSWAGAKRDTGGKPNIRISDDWTRISGYCGKCGKPFNLRISEEVSKVRPNLEGEEEKRALNWIGQHIQDDPSSLSEK